MGFPPLSKVSRFTHETKEKYLSSCMKENIEVISMQQLCMFIKRVSIFSKALGLIDDDDDDEMSGMSR